MNSCPTTKIRPSSKSRRPRRSVRRLASLTAAMLAYQITPADCFTAVQNQPIRATSRSSAGVSSHNNAALFYANTNEPSAAFYHDSSFTNTILGTSSSRKELPIWLSTDRTHLYESNLQRLTDFLRESLFSEDAIQKLREQIAEAAGSDRNMAAGAAEFCLILAETMEMGLHALTAAVEHFCLCVRAARERGSYDSPSRDSIVADAARLKQLEMVANAVKQDNGRASAKDAENLRHLLLTETKDWRALAIRSAASLFRLRGILASGQPVLTKEAIRACREAFHIYAPLASRLGMHRLKNELEGAAFRILYPRQYKAVNQQQDDMTSESMRRVLETVQSKMVDLLEQDPEFRKNVESFAVTARVKEPYSLWRKMLARGYSHVLEVPDALALRIVLTAKPLSQDEPIEMTEAREKALCYYAQQLCTRNWKPVASDPRFKDYIQNPKRNGYQSLHYTAQVDEAGHRTLEVQVRTAAMHHTAEFGPRCNHWDYKASLGDSKSQQAVSILPISSNNDDSSDPSASAYLRNVQQWHWKQHANQSVEDVESYYEPMNLERADRIRARTERLQPYLQAVKNAQSDLTLERVFVFLSSREGQVLALPAGACVLDALRASTNESGVVARINGQDCAVTRRLHNGDVLQLSRATVAL